MAAPSSPRAPDHVFTVSEITALIGRLLREAIPRATVEGEISNWRVSPTGHAYFKLRDDQATLSAVMFRSALARLRFAPQDGMRVLASGAINVYAPQGQYQIQVETLREAGLGDLHLAFLRLKEKLEREGLFDPARKRPIPRLPRRIGVVTSATGAAIRDILNVLHRRFANVHVILADVRVQGREAPGEIVEAIQRLNRLGDVDVMIVGRGGGSLEDLAAFNDERVARAIAASRIPVISAVGHEIDFTIADFVADLRAPTPSAAAELVVQEQSALLRRVAELGERLGRSTLERLARARFALESLTSSYGLTQPLARVHMLAQRIDDLTAALARTARHALTAARGRWQPLDEKLRALDPDRVLARGFSVVTDGAGRVVRDADQVKVDETIAIRPQRGRIAAKVTGVSPSPPRPNAE
jgi:exodeoxyribonuclease VII large subunit